MQEAVSMIILRSMLETDRKQLKLTDEGEIYFQPDPTNPLPGLLVGQIVKGKSLLQPGAVAVNKDVDDEKVKEWLQVYVDDILQPLVVLKDEEKIQAPAREVTDKLYEALGILPRAELEKSISELDEEGRRALRQRKVRLGPVLVFLPLLSKPASVRLRALLWNIWHDKKLPAQIPNDGVTSISVAEQEIDPLYYRSIGYPVYGTRAIRVDMLDRLIGAVYDSADKGVFKAQHAMAEWLGCPISDLYGVLEAMDHKKIHDPADDVQEKEKEAQKEESKEGELKEETVSEEKKPSEEKPELATFRLRKGRAYGKPPQQEKRREQKPVRKSQKPKKAPVKKKEQKERVMSAGAAKKMENSPFAMLKDLKVQSKD